MELAVIAIVLTVFVIIAFIKFPVLTTKGEQTRYQTVTIPCDENQRIMLLSYLESHGIAYREVASSNPYRSLVSEQCYILVPENDYKRTIALIKDLLRGSD